MADKVEKPKTVTMEALEYHTYNGEEYQVGDTYDLPEDLVDSLTAQGKAARVDRAEVAKAQAKAAAAASKPSKSVEPMTTTSRSGRALAKPRGRGKK